MKKLHSLCLCIGLSALVTLSGCKKDDSDSDEGKNTTAPTSTYVLNAPSCLVTSRTIETSLEEFSYDNQQRLTRINFKNDNTIQEYTYAGNTMTETKTTTSPTGSTYQETSVHTLNAMNMISHSVVNRPDENPIEVFYTYDAEGYLKRKISKHVYNGGDIYYQGTGYAHTAGNETARYILNISDAGVVTDSTLTTTATHYTSRPGTFSHTERWNYRNGRPDANELKSTVTIVGPTETRSTQFVYIDNASNLPEEIQMTNEKGMTFVMKTTWQCQ